MGQVWIYIPPKGCNVHLDNIIDLMEKQTSKVLHTYGTSNRHRYNISKEEQESLNELSKNEDLHFIKADKGGSLVILDYSFYRERMIQEHLTDVNIYKQVDSYKCITTMNRVKKLVEKYKSTFTSKEYKFLTSFNYECPFLYGLPKLHKHEHFFDNIDIDKHGYCKASAPLELKFRPIISSRFAPTSHLSSMIDEILKPLVPKLKSYCRDTSDFLNKLPSKLEENCKLVTCDVVSLYTSIPHDLGLGAISYWLEESVDNINQRFKHTFILESVEFILYNNYFSFEDSYFLQISGTAMGTKMAPTYASLVMGFLEVKMYTRIKEVYSSDGYLHLTNSWLRYIDDCWLIWNADYGDIQIFFDIISNLDRSIKFTIEQSNKCVHFLDVQVYVGNDGQSMATDIYHKPTDSFNYVPFHSNHPKHILKNIPYVLARRIKMIVSDENVRNKRWMELKSRLSELKYPITLVNDAIRKADADQAGTSAITVADPG